MITSPPKKLNIGSTALVIVDIQGTLSRLVFDNEDLLDTVKLLIKGTQLFELKTVLTEHVPEKIGGTHPDVSELLKGIEPLKKDIFSCCGTTSFLESLKGDTTSIILAGIETHICVYQTAMDLLRAGYQVEVVSDAVSARRKSDHEIGLQRMAQAGVGIMTSEMVLYELQGVARGDRFRQLIKLVKERDAAFRARSVE